MSLAFNHPLPEWAPLPVLAACLVAGIALGAAYFFTLWRSARLLGEDGSATAAVALMAGRFALLGAALFLASLLGAGPLLAAALGVLIARFASMRRVRAAAR
jgi:NhaP-type Na+/H+ or K+/H+ antiporter